MRGKLHKSEVLLIASTLLVLKAKNISEFNQNAQSDGNALTWFASGTAHIVLISVASMVKLVHIFMARSRVSKSYLMAKLFPSFGAFWLPFNIYFWL